MSTTDKTNEPGGQATVERRRAADRWQRKGDFWQWPAIFISALYLVLLPAQYVIEDALVSALVFAACALFFSVQIAAVVRMKRCHRRARQLRSGVSA